MIEHSKIQTKNAPDQRLKELASAYQATFLRMADIKKVLQYDIQTGIKATREFVSGTIDSLVPETDIFAKGLDSDQARDGSESLHCLNVCYLSLITGKALGLSRELLAELGLAAILHDIGKTRIPLPATLKQPAHALTEKQYLERHPQSGVEILAADKSIAKNVVDAIYQHHEKCDGTGYPHKRTTPHISLLAKIIAIANTYDNLCNRYFLKRLLTPHESLSYLYTQLGDGLAPDIIKTLIKTIGLYPPGSLVELSDGNIGLVIATSRAQSTRPTIILYQAAVPREQPLIINLRDREDLNIVRSINPAETPEEVVKYLQKGDKTGLFFGTLLAELVPALPAPASLMEPADHPAACERRLTFRTKYTQDSGLKVFFQGVEADIVNISIYGICLSKEQDFSLQPQDTASVIISIDGRKFDVKGQVNRTWSAPSADGVQHFVSLQFLSQAAMRESLLSKKILYLEQKGNPAAAERRTSFRVKPTFSSGLSILFQGKAVDVVDISVGGVCISASTDFFLKSQDTVTVILNIDDKKFDVKSTVIRTWPSQSAGGLLYFASLQFLSHPAMRESLLGKKIMFLERERFLNKIV